MNKNTQKKLALLWLSAFITAIYLLPLFHSCFGLLEHPGCDCCACCAHFHHQEKTDSACLYPAGCKCRTDAGHTCVICTFIKTLQAFEKPLAFHGAPVFSEFAERNSCVLSYINTGVEKTFLPRAPPA